jgi:uncharacterized protein GlcG (DUF336 family)
MAQSGKPLFGIDSTNHETLVIFGGGTPVKGGTRWSGRLEPAAGRSTRDLEVAEAAASAFA